MRWPSAEECRGRRKRADDSLVGTVLATVAVAIAIVVAAPEALGDHPYDPRPTRLLGAVRHVIVTNSGSPESPQPVEARRLA